MAPGEPAYFRPDDDCPCVRLKRAALIVRGDTVEDGTRILVKCRVAKGALCRDCARASCCFSHHPRPRSIHTHALTPSFPPHTGPPHALASLIPGRMENVKLDLTFLDDTRISVEVAQSAAAAAAAERAAKKSKTTPVTYAVHLTGNVEHDYEVTDAPNGASSSDDELDASGSYGPESSSEDESSESSARRHGCERRRGLGLRELGQRQRPRRRRRHRVTRAGRQGILPRRARGEGHRR